VCYLTRKLILTLPQSPARVRRIIRDQSEARELFKKSITSEEKRRQVSHSGRDSRVFPLAYANVSCHSENMNTLACCKKKRMTSFSLVIRTISSPIPPLSLSLSLSLSCFLSFSTA